jgi:hypothetical protein
MSKMLANIGFSDIIALLLKRATERESDFALSFVYVYAPLISRTTE